MNYDQEKQTEPEPVVEHGPRCDCPDCEEKRDRIEREDDELETREGTKR